MIKSGTSFKGRAAAALLALLMALSTITTTVMPLISVAYAEEEEDGETEEPSGGFMALGITPPANFVFVPETGTITGYIGTDTDIEIPDMIEGTAVTAIGPSAFFQKGLTSVILPEGLVSIGANAFADNQITSITPLPSTLASIGASAFQSNLLTSLTLESGISIGNYAFRNNSLTTLVLPSSLTSIPRGAFMENELSSVDLSNITELGDSAFEANSFDTVALPNTLTAYGNRVFAGNGKYVIVTGGNGLPYTYSVAGRFGELVNPRTLTIKFQTLEGQTLMSDKVLTNNVNVQAADISGLIYEGSTYSYTPAAITGYAYAGESPVLIPIQGNTTHIAQYMDDNHPPIFQGLTTIIVEPGGTVDLRAGVTAMDVHGNDLTDRININSSLLDLNYAGIYSITYKVTDEDGRTTTAYRRVIVGSDPLLLSVGNGWIYGDFTYDGDILTGLSDAGKTKYATKKDVVLPGENPLTGDPLVTIADNAFNEDGYSGWRSVDFNKLTALRTIGAGAFARAPITALDVTRNKALVTIGEAAFRDAQLLWLDLAGLPNLESIGDAAFNSSPLIELFVHDCPNLRFIGTENATSAAQGVFANAVLTALDFTGDAKLETIGGWAFNKSPITLLDFTLLAGSLKVLGNAAFHRVPLSRMTGLASCVNIEVLGNLTSGGNADASIFATNSASMNNIFYSYQIIDGAGMTKLRQIGNYALANLQMVAGFQELIINRPNLVYIGDYAFYMTSIIPISDLTPYDGYSSFSSSFSSMYAYPDINLSASKNLAYVGDYAFFLGTVQMFRPRDGAFPSLANYAGAVGAGTGSYPGTLVLTGLNKLRYIGDYAFTSMGRSVLSISGLTGLEHLGAYAFEQLYAVDSVDFSDMKKLREIPAEVLRGMNSDGALYITDDITALDGSIVRKPSTDAALIDPQRRLWVYTETVEGTPLVDFLYTYDAAASAATSTMIYINKLGYRANIVDENGIPITNPRQQVIPLSYLGRPYEAPAPNVAGYVLVGDATKTIPSVERGNKQTVTFVYKKASGVVAPNITLELQNAATTRYLINTEAQMNLQFSLSGYAAQLLPGAEIVIHYRDEYLSHDTIICNPTGGGAIESVNIEKNMIHLMLDPNRQGGGTVTVPFTFKDPYYTTPYNNRTYFDAYLVDGDGTILASTPLNASKWVEWYYSAGEYALSSSISFLTEYMANGQNMTGGVTTDGNNYYTLGTEKSVPIYLGMRYDQAVSTAYFYRNIGAYDVTIPLPTYINRYGITVTAQFVSSTGYPWVLSPDGKTVTLHVEQSPGSGYSRVLTGIPGLPLRFPEARINQRITVNSSIVLTPSNANATELAMVANSRDTILHYSDSIYFNLIGASQAVKDGSFEKYPQASASYFYDDENLAAKEFQWRFEVFANPNDIGVQGMKDIVITDHDMDARLYYYRVQNSNAFSMRITSYNSQGQVLAEDILEASQNEYFFPEDIRTNIHHVQMEWLDGAIVPYNTSTYTYIYAKLRNPNALEYYSLMDSQTLTFSNSATLACEGTSVHIANTVTSTGGHTMRHRVVEEWFRVSKTSSKAGAVWNGDDVTFTLSIAGNARRIRQLNNFVMVDLLPDGLLIKDVQISGLLLTAVNGRYQIIQNYKGTGHTAIVFMADRLTPSGGSNLQVGFSSAVATITTVADYTFTADVINQVYAKVDNLPLTNTTSDVYSINGGRAVSYAKTESRYFTVEESLIQKYVRTTGSDWSLIGAKGKANAPVDYKISLINLTNFPKDNAVVYDIFPFIGDTSIDTRTFGGTDYIARGSQFRNALIAAPTAPAGWTIYYVEDPAAVNTKTYYQAASWSLSYSSLANVTGVKFVAAGPMAPNSRADFFLSMRAPADAPRLLEGKRAYNTASQSDSTISLVQFNALEGNIVFNEIISPTTNIRARKIDTDTKAGLGGAVFELWDTDTNKLIATNQSNDLGWVVFSDVPMIHHYKIIEKTPPANYDLSSDVLLIDSDEMVEGVTYEAGSIENKATPPPVPTATARLTKNSLAGTAISGARFLITGTEPATSAISVYGTTTSSGVVSFYNLPLGSYHIAEVYAPGFLAPTYEEDFTLTIENRVYLLGTAGVVLNETAKIDLVKIGIYSATFQALPNTKLDVSMGKRLENVEFRLVDEATSGAAYDETSLTSSDGRLTFEGLALNTNYILTEDPASVPIGFLPRTTPYTILVDAHGTLWLDGVEYTNADSELVIGNNSDNAEFTADLFKVDQDGAPMLGVQFSIDTSKAGSGNPLIKTTDENGIVSIAEAELLAHFGQAALDNDFYVTEIKALDGYFKDDTAWKINVVSGYVSRTFVNTATRLDIFKYTQLTNTTAQTLQYLDLTDLFVLLGGEATADDLDRQDIVEMLTAAQGKNVRLAVEGNHIVVRKAVAGARIKVYEVDDETNSFEAYTDADGNLPIPGSYKLDEEKEYAVVEAQAPSGYKRNSAIQTFKVADLKKLSVPGDILSQSNGSDNASFDGTISILISNDPIRGNLRIVKLDIKTGEPLSGAEFALYNLSNTMVGSPQFSDENGVVEFNDLEIGSYQLWEVNPPADYEPLVLPIAVVTSNDSPYVYRAIYNRAILDEPEAHKDVEGVQLYTLANRGDAFTWNITVDFGSDTSAWTKAEITDQINAALEVQGYTIKDARGVPVAPTLYSYSDVGNLITVELNKDNGTYDYLAGQSYTLALTTKIKASVTNAELMAFAEAGGIPNQAEFDFGGAAALVTEIPKAIPPYDTRNPPKDPPREPRRFIIPPYLPPKTGDAAAATWAMLMLAMAIASWVCVGRRKKNRA
ncbi:MAG: leucine-rich repeat protein [Christensenellaceae bacterium]|jgi:fimbrial isopeptide formation D2 family protein|nr:leucine-rich repeat protein [Christensenellaceae bacterium]